MIRPIDISKELEKISFQQLLLPYPELKTSKAEIRKQTKQGKGRWFMRKKVHSEGKKVIEPKTQIVSFQHAMKLLLFTGQCLGLNSISGVLQTDVSKMRCSIFSWRFVHCAVIGCGQTIAMLLSLYRLIRNPITIGSLGYFTFYFTTCITTFSSIHLGRKWVRLMRQLSNSTLNEYIDPNMKWKCYASCIIILILAAVEHILSLIARISVIKECATVDDVYGKLLKLSYGWYYDVGLPEHKAIGISLQILNVISTFNWNYADLFVMCMSLYLASLLAKINEKIISASEKHYLPSAYWRALREDYNEATHLVRSFDDVISSFVFISFASNLFFICLQIYNIFVHGFKNGFTSSQNRCPQQVVGPFGGYEFTVYLSVSAVYLFARSLIVSLTAASINAASLVPATALYNVPSSSFSSEVARFIDQVHEDNVALSGLNFFYVTRELVLSVTGTIVTYELVLLQVSNET